MADDKSTVIPFGAAKEYLQIAAFAAAALAFVWAVAHVVPPLEATVTVVLVR